MLRSVKQLIGYSLRASDGSLGPVEDFFFDDRSWTVRYIVAGTGGWFKGRRVLIAPQAISLINDEARRLPVTLSRQQVQQSPGIDTAVTVARQQEEALTRCYDWPVYWMDGVILPDIEPGTEEPTGGQAITSSGGQATATEPLSHLRSICDVSRHRVRAAGGEIGHVDDFIVDSVDWRIRYLSVDTRKWLAGKKVLLACDWIREVSWADQEVTVDIDRERIRTSPKFDPARPLNREYETQLYRYWGRQAYWGD